MALLDNRIARTIKKWLGWILRPRLSYLRIREARRARDAPPVRENLDLSALPKVTVRLAHTPEELSLVVDLYKRNPSKLIIAPRTIADMEKMRARNVEFYRIFDANGEHVGNYGFQVDRRILGYFQIEYARRSGGLGMAAALAAEQLLALRGIDAVYSQIYRENRRALTTCLSIGYEIIEDETTEKYFTLKKLLKNANVDK
jgi:RimJ/RimL family protein N-acetyltransferase